MCVHGDDVDLNTARSQHIVGRPVKVDSGSLFDSGDLLLWGGELIHNESTNRAGLPSICPIFFWALGTFLSDLLPAPHPASHLCLALHQRKICLFSLCDISVRSPHIRVVLPTFPLRPDVNTGRKCCSGFTEEGV